MYSISKDYESEDAFNDEILGGRDRTKSASLLNQDVLSELDIDINVSASHYHDNELLPSKPYLEFLISATTPATPPNQISPNSQVTSELQEAFNKISQKTKIDSLNKVLRDLKIFELFETLIG